MTITNISGKSVKKNVELEKFIPNYFDKVVEKSLQEQKEDWATFKRKYQRVLKEAKREI